MPALPYVRAITVAANLRSADGLRSMSGSRAAHASNLRRRAAIRGFRLRREALMQLEVLVRERDAQTMAGAGGGLHLMAEWYECGAAHGLMAVEQLVRSACVAATEAAELTAVGDRFCVLDDGGVSGMVLLAESHLAIRTWPATAGVALDVFVCNHRADNRQKARTLYDLLRAQYRPGRENLLQVGRNGTGG